MPVFTYSQIESWIGVAFWPFLRIGACLMVAPLFGASYVPPRLRIVLAGALTLVALPMIPPVAGPDAAVGRRRHHHRAADRRSAWRWDLRCS